MLVCIMLVMVINTAAFATVDNPKLSDLDKKELHKFLANHNVPEKKIKDLIKKTEKGIEWDCYKEENLAKIPSDFYEITLDGNEKERYYRFADGSFVNVYIGGGEVINNYHEPSEESGRMGIVRSDSFGTLYKNHKVSRIVGTTSAWFYASFYVPRPGYGASMIYTSDNSANLYNSPYGEGIAGFGATGHPDKEMIRDKEYNGNAALFRLYWFTQIEVSGGWGPFGASAPVGTTCNLYLALVNNKVYIASQLPF